MASLFPEVRRAIRHVKVGSFYSLFFSVIIIFTTIVYIQIVSQLNLPLDSSERKGNIIISDINLDMIFMTRGPFNNTSGTDLMRAGYNVSRKDGMILNKYNSSNITSSQIVQSVIRSYSEINSSTTKNVTAEETFQHLNDSKRFNKSETLTILAQHENVSDGNITVDKRATNVTDDVSLNASKAIAIENGLPHVNDFGASLLSVNISKYNDSSIINDIHSDRNFTTGRRKTFRKRNSKRPNYCPLWPPELGMFIIISDISL
jgi:hypothetical protein